jgi:hypothetical protein
MDSRMTRITLGYAALLSTVLLLADFGRLERLVAYSRDLPQLDKVVHFVMFGLLALLANLSLVRRPRWSSVGAITTGSIFVLIAATVEECSNALVAFRTCSAADLAANYLGIVCLGIVPLAGWPGGSSYLSRRPMVEQ